MSGKAMVGAWLLAVIVAATFRFVSFRFGFAFAARGRNDQRALGPHEGLQRAKSWLGTAGRLGLASRAYPDDTGGAESQRGGGCNACASGSNSLRAGSGTSNSCARQAR